MPSIRTQVHSTRALTGVDKSNRLTHLRCATLKDLAHPVAIAGGFHPFPSRTRQLSPHTPKVLGWKRPGRLGSRRLLKQNPFRENRKGFCACIENYFTKFTILSQIIFIIFNGEQFFLHNKTSAIRQARSASKTPVEASKLPYQAQLILPM